MSESERTHTTDEPKRVTKPQVWRGPLVGLKRLMQKSGFDDKKLGIAVGRSHRTVQSWRVGERSPTPKMMTILAEKLGTSVGDLFTE